MKKERRICFFVRSLVRGIDRPKKAYKISKMIIQNLTEENPMKTRFVHARARKQASDMQQEEEEVPVLVPVPVVPYHHTQRAVKQGALCCWLQE